jgi:hypothetical protein
MSMEAEKARGYSGVSDKRKRIDTLPINETFVLGGFSFRVEGKLPATIQKTRSSDYGSGAPGEKQRNYPDLSYVIGLARRKAQEGKKSGCDRGQNRDRALIQKELL